MMKKILFTVLILHLLILNLKAQHKISAYGGWTASKIQTFYSSDAKKHTVDDDLFVLPILHSPYLSFEYEYDWKQLRLSTGISTTIWGTSEFFGDTQPWAEMYLNLPIIAGIRLDLPKNWNLTIESGFEAGIRILNVGVYFLDDFTPKFRGNLNAILGVEANWKQFRLGTRLQVGLTTFRYWDDDLWFKHSGLTTYLGYTIWDSTIAKEKRAKRLAKQQAEEM
ncbi:hypothetical protein [Aureispira sp. CCB-E]|uniref:hypothetical protein n=1 Tax=Aureispira sp. CCB-E TaxID=3051121 RepID=UPI002869240F|nr:hypothetical protein [Aureispira sp. CCB-E]WMX14880.1 hypothetical protein QP953_00680 [Aureispira sp. CCB-E]